MSEPPKSRNSLSDNVQKDASALRHFRLAVVISHPIQYFAPLFRRLAQHPLIDLTVLYASLIGAHAYKDRDFGEIIAWDIPVLDGYRYVQLRSYGTANLQGFLNCTAPGIVSYVRREQYDSILVFGWANTTSWLAFAAAQKTGVPWMLYGDSNAIYEREKAWPKRVIRKFVLEQLFRRTAAFLMTGTFNRMFYESLGVSPDRCFKVPLAIDNEYFSRRADEARQRRELIRARYGIPSNVVLLLFVGKLIPRKRPHDVLCALKTLQPRLPGLGVAFVGEGILRTSLESEAVQQNIKNVFFLGFRNQAELPDIYAASDIFILPSYYDPKPLVANEAMACGLPILASDRTGIWGPDEILKGGENGFVYPCGDPTSLQEAIYRLATDSELCQQMGRQSLQIIQGFGYDQCVDGILKALAFVTHRSDVPECTPPLYLRTARFDSPTITKRKKQ